MKTALNKDGLGVLDNMATCYLSACYSGSKYKTGGHILWWVEVIFGKVIREKIQYGSNTITYFGEVLAKFEYDEDKRIPVFDIQEVNGLNVSNFKIYQEIINEHFDYFKEKVNSLCDKYGKNYHL